ncbi:hypothetical protein SRHO_G00113740 [Serrasalmus rhombeus]
MKSRMACAKWGVSQRLGSLAGNRTDSATAINSSQHGHGCRRTRCSTGHLHLIVVLMGFGTGSLTTGKYGGQPLRGRPFTPYTALYDPQLSAYCGVVPHLWELVGSPWLCLPSPAGYGTDAAVEDCSGQEELSYFEALGRPSSAEVPRQRDVVCGWRTCTW